MDEAFAVENASPYGNAASVFTESGGTACYVMERASAGMVGDITGRGSIEFWTKSKKMTTKWNREAGVNWMS